MIVFMTYSYYKCYKYTNVRTAEWTCVGNVLNTVIEFKIFSKFHKS